MSASARVLVAVGFVLSLAGCGGGDRSAPLDGGVADGPPDSPPAADLGRSMPCGDGSRLACGAACVDPTSDAKNCGSCGHACGADQICSAGQCMAPPSTCPPGGCPRGSYCDLGSNRCVAGCLSDAGCSAGQICTNRSCVAGCRKDGDCAGNHACVANQCQCTNGTTECSGVCVDTSSDGQNCGSCGHACSAPDHGTISCQASQCVSRCDSGYHLCDATCASDHDVATCGASCTPCTQPANGVATCDGTQCGFTCNSGYVPCDQGCCENCATAGCSGLTWCNPQTGLCEPGCAHNSQCSTSQVCNTGKHACEATVDSSCPSGYTFMGECSDGVDFCVSGAVPPGTTYPFEKPCPSGSTKRGGFYCSGYTYVCVPDGF